MHNHTGAIGIVYLIGAGPGDRDLITLKGYKYLEQADVVVYDKLANPQLLKHIKNEAETIYVGKQSGKHTLSQEKINELLVNKAREGNKVVRLKGGDPYVFGRGGEEALDLKKAGVPFEVVPGITAGIAGLTYAGLPVTHRGVATSVSFITGHEDPLKEQSQINWQALASMHGTLVFYMGVKNMGAIVDQLIKHEKNENTPVAIVRQGTLPEQQTVTGTLKTIKDISEKSGIRPPALVVVGDIVAFRDDLSWFENKPLFGKRIVVTRSRAQASEVVAMLDALGARVLEFPTIKIIPPESFESLDRALDNLSQYQWMVFTSVNGVQFFFDRLFARGKDVRYLSQIKLCAIGPATAARLNNYGLKPDLQPEKFVAESVVESFEKLSISGQKLLLPRADIARSYLKDALQQLDAIVDEVPIYQTVVDPDQPPEMLNQIRNGDFDLVTFTSSSTVRNFVEKVGKEHLKTVFKHAKVACIGPITRKTAEKQGIQTDIEPEQYTIPDLVNQIVQHYQTV